MPRAGPERHLSVSRLVCISPPGEGRKKRFGVFDGSLTRRFPVPRLPREIPRGCRRGTQSRAPEWITRCQKRVRFFVASEARPRAHTAPALDATRSTAPIAFERARGASTRRAAPRATRRSRPVEYSRVETLSSFTFVIAPRRVESASERVFILLTSPPPPRLVSDPRHTSLAAPTTRGHPLLAPCPGSRARSSAPRRRRAPSPARGALETTGAPGAPAAASGAASSSPSARRTSLRGAPPARS